MVSPLPSSLLHIAARKVEPDFVVMCMSHEVLWKAMVMAFMTVVNSSIETKNGIRAEVRRIAYKIERGDFDFDRFAGFIMT